MGTEQTLKVADIIRIADGIELIKENTSLPFSTSYKLGLLANYCQTPIDTAKKTKNNKIKVFNQKRDEILKDVTDRKNIPTEKQDHLNELVNKLNEELDDVDANTCLIKVPEFKLSEFVATEDIKTYVTIEKKLETIVVKKGQPLVPLAFFKAMGDLIKQD